MSGGIAVTLDKKKFVKMLSYVFFEASEEISVLNLQTRRRQYMTMVLFW